MKLLYLFLPDKFGMYLPFGKLFILSPHIVRA